MSDARTVISQQVIDLELKEAIQIIDASGIGGGDKGASATISDPDKFVGLVQSLLLIFPNGDRAVEVLDFGNGNPNVTADDVMVVATVVPQLRAMLANTPREQRRRKTRKAAMRYAAAKQALALAVENVQNAFGKLVQALR